MTEIDKSKPKPIHLQLIDTVEKEKGPVKYPITMEQLNDLFKRQAEYDESEDEPELLADSKFEITPQGLSITSSYTISDLEGGRTNLTIKGCLNNNENGFLSDETPAEISGDEKAKQRTLVAFGVQDNLPFKTFLKAIIEDSLQSKVSIKEMLLQNNNLVLEIEKPQPTSYDTVTIQRSASIFRNTLASVLAEESPFVKAPFILGIAMKYLGDGDQSHYFMTGRGFNANVYVRNGIAEPNINLNIQAALGSRNLRRRSSIRLGKENPTEEEFFQFAVGHELGHLIQGLANYASIDDQNTEGLTKSQIDDMRQRVEEYNESIRNNEDIQNAQEYFRSIFNDDISRDRNEASIVVSGYDYTNETYLSYVNSNLEANADFISLWIMGMNDPNLATSPQNEGYHLNEWQKWSIDHKIEASDLE